MNLRSFLLGSAAALLLAGCSDPAAKVAKATASDPQKTGLATSSAVMARVTRAPTRRNVCTTES